MPLHSEGRSHSAVYSRRRTGRRIRSGTENTPGIAGLGLAAQMATENIFEKQQKMAQVNDYFRKAVIDEIPDVQLNGFEEQGLELQHYGTRCPSVINFSFLGTRGEVLLHTLEQDGIFVSTGSACASHHTGDSHVCRPCPWGIKKLNARFGSVSRSSIRWKNGFRHRPPEKWR